MHKPTNDYELSDVGVFSTSHASRYLQQLCKHFAHKVDVDYDANSGHAALPPGPVKFTAASDSLTAHIYGDDAAGLSRSRSIIDDHLKRFAFREGFETMTWQRAG